jgi:membrane-bound lytic murein transglycosylase A
MRFALRRETFSDLPGWADDHPAAAFAAFRRSARRAIEHAPYKTGSLGLAHTDFQPAYLDALSISDARVDCLTGTEARAFFETWFRPVEIVTDEGAGLVTGYYEPEIEVSAEASQRYRYPFLRPPADLTKVLDPENPPPGVARGYAFMLDGPGGTGPCPDRREIETGALDGQNLEIAWAANRADVFFAHVQGCARLRFSDRPGKRITYAGKSGHRFTGIGRLLVDRGEIAADRISMASIRQWLADNPDRADDLMRENRSFIFFREADVDDQRLGPIAAAKVPLEPGRSLAVDRHIHSFGTPVFVSVPDLRDFDADRSFARLMIAQDTGSAIVGPARGDLFAGSGTKAGDKAGSINNRARFLVLAPRGSNCARRAGHGQ